MAKTKTPKIPHMISTTEMNHRLLAEIRVLGRIFGFGAIMQATNAAWNHQALELRRPGEERTIGPAAATTVLCECPEPGKCEWCCGSGWLTKHVKSLKEKKA